MSVGNVKLIFVVAALLAFVYGRNNTTHRHNTDVYINHIMNTQFLRLPTSVVKRMMASNPTDNATVLFYFYNRKQPKNSIVINKDVHLIDSKRPLKMIVHGWNQHYYADWCKLMKDAYLKKGTYNVIILDWSKKSSQDYLFAALSLHDVAQIISHFLVDELLVTKKMSASKIHIVSHSLGCHLAGIVGQHFFEMTKTKLGRITALDPANPIFDSWAVDKNDRLSEDDADFVDIIHTDGGFTGMKKAIGKVDYFVNGGHGPQPGCTLTSATSLHDELACSHKRSLQIFTRSIVFDDLKATPCKSWDMFLSKKCEKNTTEIFGEWSPTNITGNYYLSVNETVFNQKVL